MILGIPRNPGDQLQVIQQLWLRPIQHHGAVLGSHYTAGMITYFLLLHILQHLGVFFPRFVCICIALYVSYVAAFRSLA